MPETLNTHSVVHFLIQTIFYCNYLLPPSSLCLEYRHDVCRPDTRRQTGVHIHTGLPLCIIKRLLNQDQR